MKNKLKNTLEHEVELLGRSISVLAIAGLLVVGGASAALLDSFGTVEGQTQVEQAVDVVGEDDNVLEYAFDSAQDGITAPETYAETITLENNNEDTEVSFNWDSTVTSADWDNGDGVQTGVYQVETFDLYQTSYGEDPESVDDVAEANADVEVTPSGENVTYTVELPSGYSYVNVEVTPETGDNYHVGYDGQDFISKDPSGTGSPQSAEDLEEFESGSASNGEVSLTVDRAEGYSQSFFVHIGGEFDEDEQTRDLMMTEEALRMDIDDNQDYSGDSSEINGPGYSDTGTFGHESFTMTDLIDGSEESLEGGASQTYNTYTHFQSNIRPGSYTVDVFAAPATS